MAIDITSSRSEGGKAPGPTRARCILKATETLVKIATSPTPNGMAVAVEILGHLKIRRALWRRRPQDHLTPKGQGLGGRMGADYRLQTGLFIASQVTWGAIGTGIVQFLMIRETGLNTT
jgi:hypothetical protein